MTAYYNEIDPNAAAWLRQLIEMGAIAPGDVDERSIEDVTPNDLATYTQVHFFAGIGVWSYALRQSGIPDDSPVWTGSCPCQPFSTAGEGKGTADERHLWPAMFWLIQQCRPSLVFGEQVASKDGLGWWDIVASDLESSDYSCAAVDLCAAGVGAPHIRQRLYWVAHTESTERKSTGATWNRGTRLANGSGDRDRFVVNSNGNGRGKIRHDHAKHDRNIIEPASPNLHGFWSDSEWLSCSDGKIRPTKPGTFPLVNGITPDVVRSGDSGIQTEETSEARAIRLRGYGNSIVAPLAVEFIRMATQSVLSKKASMAWAELMCL